MISIVACCHGAKFCAHALGIFDRNSTMSLPQNKDYYYCNVILLLKQGFANLEGCRGHHTSYHTLITALSDKFLR